MYRKTAFECYNGNNRIFAEALIPERSTRKAIVMCHAYNSSYADMLDAAETFAENGLVVVYFDFCGGSVRSRSEGKSTDMSLKSEQDDLLSVLAAVKKLGIADDDQIYLYGESQGGCISAITMEQAGAAGAFLVYPALCIPDNWRGRRLAPDEQVDFMGMSLSGKFIEGLPEYDIYEHISSYQKPVMIFHGDADRLVPLSYSERAVSVLPNAKLTVYSGEGHGFSKETGKKMALDICKALKD